MFEIFRKHLADWYEQERYKDPVRLYFHSDIFRKMNFPFSLAHNLLIYGEYDPPSVVMLPEQKLAYVVISKAACTSIKMAIANTLGISTKAAHIHSAILPQRFGALDHYTDHYTFTFVRNPYARLVSCYRSRIITPLAGRILNGQNVNRFQWYGNFNLHTELSFADFVSRVSKIPDRLAERHFKSQASTLSRKGKLLVNYVGKVENMEHDWDKLAHNFDLSSEVTHENSSAQSAASYDYQTYYTPTTAKLIYDRYIDDFALFGYEKESFHGHS